MNRLFILLLVAMAWVGASATEFQWLTFNLTDGTDLSVAAENLSLTYADGKLSLKSDKVNETLQLESLISMKFSNTNTGIGNIHADDAKLSAYVYSMTGVKIGTFANIDEARESLPSGVYLVKQGEKTVKVIF